MGSRRTIWRSRKMGWKRTTLIARMKKHGIFRPPQESTRDQAFDSKLSSNGTPE
jgi:hypothetical protein